MFTMRRILDGFVLVCGLWMVVSSTFLLPMDRGLAIGSMLIFGLFVMAMAMWAETDHSHAAPELLNILLGVAIFVSPWILRFNDVPAMSWNCWLIGSIIVVLEFIAMPPNMFLGPPRHLA